MAITLLKIFKGVHTKKLQISGKVFFFLAEPNNERKASNRDYCELQRKFYTALIEGLTKEDWSYSVSLFPPASTVQHLPLFLPYRSLELVSQVFLEIFPRVVGEAKGKNFLFTRSSNIINELNSKVAKL